MPIIELSSFSSKGLRTLEGISILEDGSIQIFQDTHNASFVGEESIEWVISVRPEHHWALRTALRDNVQVSVDTGDNTQDSIAMMKQEFAGREGAFSMIKALLQGCNVKFQFDRW